MEMSDMVGQVETKSKLDKFKEKRGIKSNLQLFTILLVFSVTGSTSLWIRTPLMEFIGLDKSLSGFIYWPVSIVLAIICYQIMLVVNGTIVGQFKFFWEFEKKMLSRFSRSKK